MSLEPRLRIVHKWRWCFLLVVCAVTAICVLVLGNAHASRVVRPVDQHGDRTKAISERLNSLRSSMVIERRLLRRSLWLIQSSCTPAASTVIRQVTSHCGVKIASLMKGFGFVVELMEKACPHSSARIVTNPRTNQITTCRLAHRVFEETGRLISPRRVGICRRQTHQ